MAEKKLKVDIITPNQTLYSGEADLVNVPGILSPFEILFNHAPIVSGLDRGIIKIDDKKEGNKRFISSSGFIEVLNNKVSILVEKAFDENTLKVEDLNKNIDTLTQKLHNLEQNSNEFMKLRSEIEFEEYCKKIISK
ncbi:MAG TPA: ATP synthase F1 subunit epsilon [Candidatus Kapabacteria bacterium]|nr:ATP synthase F1 subunit epsilon [Candidatus Kapabacteria bacterium]